MYLPIKSQRSAVQVENVVYKNIKGTSASDVALKFDCSKSFPCLGIVLQDIKLEHQGEKTAKALCNNIDFTIIGVVSPSCTPNSEEGHSTKMGVSKQFLLDIWMLLYEANTILNIDWDACSHVGFFCALMRQHSSACRSILRNRRPTYVSMLFFSDINKFKTEENFPINLDIC